VQEAIEERGFDLAEEDIRLHPELAESVPPLALNMPALRQALLCCIDAAAVGLRAAGAGGAIELVTGVDGDEGHVVVGVRAGAGALPPSALRQLGATPLATKATGELDASLGLAREIVSQLGGTLTGHNRRQGGTDLWIRLPIPAATPLLQRRGGGASAP
jgi:C4-dicarboxylate-specific signal transduction histidine kinase